LAGGFESKSAAGENDTPPEALSAAATVGLEAGLVYLLALLGRQHGRVRCTSLLPSNFFSTSLIHPH
jgi:hypothetical protein